MRSTDNQDNAVQAGATPRQVNWAKQIRAVEDFVANTGELPCDSRSRRADPAAARELRLARFLRYQRTIEETLTDYQWHRLAALEGFEWEPIEEAWQRQFDAYRKFVEAHARVPRRRSKHKYERQLANWFQRQQTRHRRGTLPHHLSIRFDRLLRMPESTEV